eukprot:GHVU01107148.1.p1 GENE.GHVU01107148.1~~GHVU01107148.1.p1  ORF type:complete len:924 (-),score=101.66 GHVU01107148.1:14-2785(-)
MVINNTTLSVPFYVLPDCPWDILGTAWLYSVQAILDLPAKKLKAQSIDETLDLIPWNPKLPTSETNHTNTATALPLTPIPYTEQYDECTGFDFQSAPYSCSTRAPSSVASDSPPSSPELTPEQPTTLLFASPLNLPPNIITPSLAPSTCSFPTPLPLPTPTLPPASPPHHPSSSSHSQISEHILHNSQPSRPAPTTTPNLLNQQHSPTPPPSLNPSSLPSTTATIAPPPSATIRPPSSVFEPSIAPSEASATPTAAAAETQRLEDEMKKIPPQLLKVVNPHLPCAERLRYLQHLAEFEPIWKLPLMGKCNVAEHNIYITPGVHPISRKPRKLSPAMQETLREILDDLLQAGAIEGSKSPWASNVVMVPKPNGSWRMCVDYRDLNKLTVRDSYPMQRVDDALRALEGAKCFACIDLKAGYHQVKVAETARDYTAFSTPFGLYRFKVMPFGLCNAPATFQRVVDLLFDDFRFRGIGAYIDDIVVYADSHQELRELLHIVYERLLFAGLFANIEKMHLGYTELEYLWFIVSKHGIHTDPAKISAISQLTRPTNVPAVRRFLGAVGFFRRFIRAFAAKAEPLNRLLKKETEWQWGAEQEYAWNKLKNTLKEKPIVLAHADPSNRYYLDTDASGKAVGAALMQKDKKGRMRVLAYASKTLSPTECVWPVREQEAFAIFYAITHFASYLRGAPEFTVRTDHESLTWLWSLEHKRLTRWRLALAEYDFIVQYQKGAKHHLPDLLSRDVPPIISEEDIDQRICLSRHVFLSLLSPLPSAFATLTEDLFTQPTPPNLASIPPTISSAPTTLPNPPTNSSTPTTIPTPPTNSSIPTTIPTPRTNSSTPTNISTPPTNSSTTPTIPTPTPPASTNPQVSETLGGSSSIRLSPSTTLTLPANTFPHSQLLLLSQPSPFPLPPLLTYHSLSPLHPK